MKRFWSIPLMLMLFACQTPKESREELSLAGCWELRLDSTDVTEQVQLPGTTDTNQKGYPNNDKEETTHLSRPFRYQGKAWYQKEITIPENWEGKSIWLILERTKPTQIWVDSIYVGSSDHISTPQEYDLSTYLRAGKHHLTILVDNGLSVPPQLLDNSHAYTESTQTNWNGIIGDLKLEARPQFHIRRIQVYPHADQKTVDVKIKLSNPFEQMIVAAVQIEMEAFNTGLEHHIKFNKNIVVQQDEIIFQIPMGDDALEWSEFSPTLYRLTANIQGENIQDSQSTTFGLRDFKAEGTQFNINGLTTFLRGKHDACVFPLTGHVPMDTAAWRRYFRIAKEYGINHCRFHSWCPPKACFEAADIEGFYLQPELPFWGKMEKGDTTLIHFLTKEGLQIQEAYGNHASFVMMAIGNELSGDQEAMVDMIARFRSEDGRHLYASGSNDYLGFNGPAAGDDYFTTCRVPGANVFSNHTRGSFSFADAEDGGYINHTYPNSVMNFESAIEQCSLPIIGHETGQFQCYPNYEEIKKYTGALKPWNLEIFRKRLGESGMAGQADDFFKASGKWMAQLYRAEMEMAFRTPGMAGFQLLDLQDYPGQGSAYVGILDAFMDSKGLVEPKKWREFCSEVVPLLTTAKFCWTGGESFAGTVEIANYGETSLNEKSISWELKNGKKSLGKGKMAIPSGLGLLTAGTIRLTLPDVEQAYKAELLLKVSGTSYQNSYPLWIYPAKKQLKAGNVVVARQLTDDVLNALKQGGKVLLMPLEEDCKEVTVGGLFQTDYWNYRMFKSICDRIKKPASPGTLGILTNPEHPVFDDFPTEYHTNWQWYPIIKHSYPLILDGMPKEYRPIVQVIDNVERNHKLGLLMELNVEGSKLLLCMSDLEAVRDTPEGLQFYAALLAYMNSSDFKPSTSLSVESFKNLFETGVRKEGIKVLDNISYE